MSDRNSMIEAANTALKCFAPESHIHWMPGKGWVVSWVICGNTYHRRWAVRPGSFYPSWYRKWGHGGTAVTALAQLIRWLRGTPCLSISSWRYWASEPCKLLRHGDHELAIGELLANGYPERNTCVLCGRVGMDGVDWWSLDGVEGPCCSMRTGCKQKGKRCLS